MASIPETPCTIQKLQTTGHQRSITKTYLKEIGVASALPRFIILISVPYFVSLLHDNQPILPKLLNFSTLGLMDKATLSKIDCEFEAR